GRTIRAGALLLPAYRPGRLRAGFRRGNGCRAGGGGMPGGGGAGDRGGSADRPAGESREARGAGPGAGNFTDESRGGGHAGPGRRGADRRLRPRAGGAPIRPGSDGMSALASTTRRFTFSAGHRYHVAAWSVDRNEQTFGRLTVPH